MNALLTHTLAEIRQLHAFFEDWFRGRIPRETERFARFADVLDRSFVLVAPSGERASASRLVEYVESLHSSRSPEFSIRVEEAEAQFLGDEHALASYIEVQQDADGQTRRRSTAVFTADGEAPNGVRWLRVHETWIDGPQA